MRAADVIVQCLEQHEIPRVYCVPGESYLTLLDALGDSTSVRTIACRHESGAGFMAVAEAKMTGRTGVFMVSRGPGATNGSIAVHVAEQDAAPVVVLIGQVSREERGRGAFQEVDYDRFFGGIAKGVTEVSDPGKLPEVLARSFHLAQAGTPGPVVVVMPEDMLGEEVTKPLPAPYPLSSTRPAPDQVAAVAERLARAERPLIMAGGRLRSEAGIAALARLAERHRVPVAAAWKSQDVFDNSSPLYAGHLGFGNPAPHRELLGESDLIIALGTRLTDVATQNYKLPQAPEPRQPLIHVYPDPNVIGRVFSTDTGIACDAAAFTALLADAEPAVPSGREQWIGRISGFVDDFMAFTPRNSADGVDFGAVVNALSEAADEDAVVITDAGNFGTWVHRHWRLTPKNRLLGMISGAMGFGVPAGVAASLAEPGRQVIVVVGDGGVLMTGNELATAVLAGATPKIVISDNGSYGTIRAHQEKNYPTRVVATDLKNPDFALWAQAFGAAVFAARPGDDLAAVTRRMLAHDGPAVLAVQASLESLSAFTTLSALRGAAAE